MCIHPGYARLRVELIVEEHGSDAEGVVPAGIKTGLIRVNDCEAEAISGRGDAIDSLKSAVNDVLSEALRGAGLRFRRGD